MSWGCSFFYEKNELSDESGNDGGAASTDCCAALPTIFFTSFATNLATDAMRFYTLTTTLAIALTIEPLVAPRKISDSEASQTPSSSSTVVIILRAGRLNNPLMNGVMWSVSTVSIMPTKISSVTRHTCASR